MSAFRPGSGPTFFVEAAAFRGLTKISIRRLILRPAAVVLAEIGLTAPKVATESRDAGMSAILLK